MPRLRSSRGACYRPPYRPRPARAFNFPCPRSQFWLPHHQSPPRPVTDASPSTDDLGAQETGAEDNIVAIPEDAVAAATPENETRQSRAHFITLRKVGCGPFYHCQIQSRSVASSGERLLRSEPEDALVLDRTTTSVSFALVDGDPIAAAKRVYNRLISSQGFVDADIMMKELDGFLERFLLWEYGYGVDSTPTV